ncbi:MAG: zinc finger domain-containing protein [archaeon]
MDKPLECISCKKRLTNDKGSVRFMCPSCGKHEIIRCKKCRQIVVKYKCPECGFEGPN